MLPDCSFILRPCDVQYKLICREGLQGRRLVWYKLNSLACGYSAQVYSFHEPGRKAVCSSHESNPTGPISDLESWDHRGHSLQKVTLSSCSLRINQPVIKPLGTGWP